MAASYRHRQRALALTAQVAATSAKKAERMMALMSAQAPLRRSPKRVNRKASAVDFALQGGGAHGAFAWGVLDRALQMPRMQLDGISGTSAGAMNAAVLGDGYAEAGPKGARGALERFWRRVSDAAKLSPLCRGPLDILLGNWTLDNSPMFIAMDLASRVFSPYDLGVAALNPLRDILAESIDFGRLRKSPIKIFITATNVQTGRGRVFRNAELTRPSTRYSHRRACRRCTRRSKLTGSLIGTAAMPATRRLLHSFANATRATRF